MKDEYAGDAGSWALIESPSGELTIEFQGADDDTPPSSDPSGSALTTYRASRSGACGERIATRGPSLGAWVRTFPKRSAFNSMAFWNVVFHTLTATDGYLDVASEAPHPLRASQPPLHHLPERPYTRDELLDYIDFCRAKAKRTFELLTDADAEGPSLHRPPRDTLAHVLIHNLLHLKEHAAQLDLFLNLRGDWSDERWLTTNRWFTPCEYCEVKPHA